MCCFSLKCHNRCTLLKYVRFVYVLTSWFDLHDPWPFSARIELCSFIRFSGLVLSPAFTHMYVCMCVCIHCFSTEVLPELQAHDVNAFPILKADALKFVITFRTQVSRSCYCAFLEWSGVCDLTAGGLSKHIRVLLYLSNQAMFRPKRRGFFVNSVFSATSL